MQEATVTQVRLNNDVVAELAVKAAQKPGVAKIEVDGEEGVFLVLPQGLRAESIKKFVDEYRERPARKTGTVRLGDLASFIDLVERFKDSESVIFARAAGQPSQNAGSQPPVLEAVFNYHEPTHLAEGTGDKGQPRFGDHRAIYAFPVSEEWLAWTRGNGKQMSQEEFAAFVEDRIGDVADPGQASGTLADFFRAKLGVEFATPARLMELSRGLSVRVGQRVRNAQNLATGEAQVQFIEEHADEAGVPLKIPGAFVLAIPVFQFGAPYQVAARLRYRLAGGSINWFYELHRADRIFDHAFKEACDTAQERTGLPLFIGSPE